MSTGNINLDILLGQINTDRLAGTDASIPQIMKRYPSLSWKQAEEIYKMVSTAYGLNSSIDASLVVTVPPSFAVKAKSTKNTVESLIQGAERNILITGYSLSGYFADLLDVLIEKSQKGIIFDPSGNILYYYIIYISNILLLLLYKVLLNL